MCCFRWKKIDFLCSTDDVSQPVLEFLEYVTGRSITGSFAENLESEVQRAKDEEKWRAEYMQNMAAIMDARREGRAEGRAEGLAEGRMEQSRVFYQNCIKRGMSDEDARALSGYQGKD